VFHHSTSPYWLNKFNFSVLINRDFLGKIQGFSGKSKNISIFCDYSKNKNSAFVIANGVEQNEVRDKACACNSFFS